MASAVDARIDLERPLSLLVLGREKIYELVTQAADETHGNDERVMARIGRLEELIADSEAETYEERAEDAIAWLIGDGA